MATDSIFVPASAHEPTYRPVNRTVDRVFYSGMAILLCVCVYIGFSPTYFQAGMLRAQAMAFRDVRASDITDADWAAIGAQLRSSYALLKQAVAGPAK